MSSELRQKRDKFHPSISQGIDFLLRLNSSTAIPSQLLKFNMYKSDSSLPLKFLLLLGCLSPCIAVVFFYSISLSVNVIQSKTSIKYVVITAIPQMYPFLAFPLTPNPGIQVLIIWHLRFCIFTLAGLCALRFLLFCSILLFITSYLSQNSDCPLSSPVRAH